MKQILSIYLFFNILFLNAPIELFHHHEHGDLCELVSQSNFDAHIFQKVKFKSNNTFHFHEKEYDCDICQFLTQHKLIQFKACKKAFVFFKTIVFYFNFDTENLLQNVVYSVSNKGSPIM